MIRCSHLTAVLGIVALLATGSPAFAQKPDAKKKKKAPEAPAVTTFFGTITKVSDDGKTFTITSAGGNKKQPATTTEFKVTDRTNVEYIGIDSKDAQKLSAGYAAIVAFDGKDKETATIIRVARAGDAPAKKKTAKKP